MDPQHPRRPSVLRLHLPPRQRHYRHAYVHAFRPIGDADGDNIGGERSDSKRFGQFPERLNDAGNRNLELEWHGYADPRSACCGHLSHYCQLPRFAVGRPFCLGACNNRHCNSGHDQHHSDLIVESGSIRSAVTFIATLATFSTTTTVPAGSVSFYDGTSLLSTTTLTRGNASYSTSGLSVGSHNITADFTPTANFSASTSNVVVQVIDAATFTLSAAPSSQALYTGEAATYTATVTPGTEFNLPVALSCSQLPANTTCAFSPATVNGGRWSSTLTVQTTAPATSTATSTTSASNSASGKRGAIGLAGVLLLFIPRRLRRSRNAWHALLFAFAFGAAFMAITACARPAPISGGTPVGLQTITITGTATNGSQSITQTTAVTLNVRSLF